MTEQKTVLGTIIVAATLTGLLAACAGVAAYLWIALGEVQMSGHGWFAMSLAIVVSLALGIGLMTLVFISSRRGFDDNIGSRDPQDSV